MFNIRLKALIAAGLAILCGATASAADSIWHVDSGGHNFPVWKNDLYLFAQRIFR